MLARREVRRWGDMMHGGAAAARDTAPAGRPAPGSASAESPAWAPLRQPAFRWLRLGVLICSIGTVMQTVGAQGLLVEVPNAAALVSLEQMTNTLPVMLLAPAGGVLADAFEQRRLLLVVQAYFFAIGMLLVVLTLPRRRPAGRVLDRRAAGLRSRAEHRTRPGVVRYAVTPERQPAFLEAMAELRRS